MPRAMFIFFAGTLTGLAGAALAYVLFPAQPTVIPATVRPMARPVPVIQEHPPVPTPRSSEKAQAVPSKPLEWQEPHITTPTREQIAALIIPKGRKWEAENGDEETRAHASQLLAKMDRLEAKLDKEKPDEARAFGLTSELHERLANSDSHVQDSVCGQTLCRVDVIHENDLTALNFKPSDLLGATGEEALVDIMLDRADEDGQLRHTIYFRDLLEAPVSQRKAAYELEKQRKILTKVSP